MDLIKAKEPNIKALKFGLGSMLNEGLEIENETAEVKRELLDQKKVGRIITELGMTAVAGKIGENVVASTKIDDQKKRIIHEEDETIVDFSWLLYIGHCLLGFDEKAVGHMTFAQLLKLYNHYKNDYDFKLKHISYAELERKIMESEEWIPD